MRHTPMLFVGAAMLAVGLVAAPASWANSLTVYETTFTLTDQTGSFRLVIDNALNATGEWAPITHIRSFELRNTGVGSMSAPTGWVKGVGELNAHGCGSHAGGGNYGCFEHTAPLALTNHMVFDIGYTGKPNLSEPHFKVNFGHYESKKVCERSGKGKEKCHYEDVYKKDGTLVSRDLPPSSVPEPASMLLLGGGLAGLGIWRRKAA